MNYQEFSALLAEQLSEERIFAVLREILSRGPRAVELDGEWVPVPLGTPFTLVSRSLNTSPKGTPFGAYRATVAVGGLEDEKNGVLIPGICFATLHFNSDAELITVDFFRSWVR